HRRVARFRILESTDERPRFRLPAPVHPLHSSPGAGDYNPSPFDKQDQRVTTPPEPHVEFEDIAKSYDGRVLAVQGLNLAVRRGEFLSLLGPSGSGKTTCLMMLAGFETPTTGAIRINGRRGIGMVFQDYALFPHMTVEDNLAFPLDVRGIGRERRGELVDRALQLVRLEGFQMRRPGQLSGGQQQRVAIARALVFEPELVLMDEPLGALDRHLREEMQYEIRRIHRTLGVTIVYVTHDQQEAMVMSDRIAVLRDGMIEQIAPPEALYEEPNRSFVARFIGENNRLHGRVAGVLGDLCEVAVGDKVVQALRVVDCAPGDRVTLSSAPSGGDPPGGCLYTNEFDALIEHITFVGITCAFAWRHAGRPDFIAKIPQRGGAGAVLEGDQIPGGMDADRLPRAGLRRGPEAEA
ncbi:Spermidine/putrescine import ATP-binding protein PotA, partial [Geodia barretti]